MLFVAFHFVFALSQPVDSNSILQEIISFFIFNFAFKDKSWVYCPLILHFNKLVFQLHALSGIFPQMVFCPLSSSNTVCILSLQLLLFLARNYGIVYLLHSQLLVCKLIKFDASHKPPGCLSQLCCFDHVNGVPLTQVKWNVNAVLGLCWQGNLFCVCSSKTTLRGSRIATFTKTRHIYCTQFAEQILSFTGRLMTATVGFAEIRPRQ
jgi:hypothetical protein